jgi:hypothetical protein
MKDEIKVPTRSGKTNKAGAVGCAMVRRPVINMKRLKLAIDKRDAASGYGHLPSPYLVVVSVHCCCETFNKLRGFASVLTG